MVLLPFTLLITCFALFSGVSSAFSIAGQQQPNIRTRILFVERKRNIGVWIRASRRPSPYCTFGTTVVASLVTARTTRKSTTARAKTTSLFVSSGFSFSDGNQILVSVQKPLGILLEQQSEQDPIVVSDILDPNGSAARAGVQVGDILLAVQNVQVQEAPGGKQQPTKEMSEVLQIISSAPKVLNLRFLRR